MLSPTHYTIIVDTREGRPLHFPATLEVYDRLLCKITKVTLQEKKVGLSEGDYSLEGFESQVVVERKGSLREIYSNLLTNDVHRQLKVFQRLQNIPHRALFIETPPSQILAKPSAEVPHPGAAMSILVQMCRVYHLDLLWMPPATSATAKLVGGTLVAHYLIGTILSNHYPVRINP
jgi:hypothetical protein